MSDIRTYKTLQRDGWEIWSAEEVGRIIDKFHVEIDWNASDVMRQTSGYFPARKLPVCGQRPRLMMRYRFEAQAEG